MSYPSSIRGSAYNSHRPSSHWQTSQRRGHNDPRYSAADTTLTSSSGQSAISAASAGQVWSSTSHSNSNYSAVYGAEGPSSSRSAGKLRSSAQRSGRAKGDSAGLKGKDFSYAFIGKEAEKYAREALSQQIDNFAAAESFTGDAVAPSPRSSSALKPAAVVEEFSRSGHFQLARSELLSSFSHPRYKDFLANSIEEFLLKRIASLSPEERKKLNSQDTRVQELEIAKWIDDSSETEAIFDALFEKMREENAEETGLFQSQGAVGKIINDGLTEVIREETLRAEQKNMDVSDGENVTPMHKGDSTPLQSAIKERFDEQV